MPCDCSGFETEYSAFGRRFTGTSGGTTGSGANMSEQVPWQEMVEEGEKALCKAQDVIVQLICFPNQINDDPELREKVCEQLRMLIAHKDREGEDASLAKQLLQTLE